MMTYYEAFCCATPDLVRAATRAFVTPHRNYYVWRNNSLNQHLANADFGISTIVVEQSVQHRRCCTQQLKPPPKAAP